MRGLEPWPPLTNHQLEDSCTEFSPALQQACLLACRQVSSFTCPQSASLPLSPSLTAGSNNASAIRGKHGGAGQTYDTRICGRLLCSSDAKLLLLPCRPDRAVPCQLLLLCRHRCGCCCSPLPLLLAALYLQGHGKSRYSRSLFFIIASSPRDVRVIASNMAAAGRRCHSSQCLALVSSSSRTLAMHT